MNNSVDNPKNKGGRPRKLPAKLSPKNGENPLKFLLEVMNDPEADAALRVRAAGLAAQYVHTKRADGGKKDEKQRIAETAVTGRFAPAGAPKLVVNNNK